MTILAADIGGTHARFAAIENDAGALRVVFRSRYPSREFPGLDAVIRAFVAESRMTFDRACVGIACPITDDICEASNLPWRTRVSALPAQTGIPQVIVINDFAALACSVTHLLPQDLVTLQQGQPEGHAPIALIGAGTGLGQSFLLWDGARYRAHASEGGHATLAARSPDERALAASLWREFGHVSFERVLSGPGLVNVYRYFAAERGVGAQDAVRLEVERDGPAAVTRHAMARTDACCTDALDLFASVYGAQAGNLALTVMATGGVFIGGGIAARVVDKLRDGTFVRAFNDKGRLGDVLERIPVHVIANPDAALMGAAAVAAGMAVPG